MPEIQEFKSENFERDAIPDEYVIDVVINKFGVTREDVIALRRYDTASRYRQNDAITRNQWLEETSRMFLYIKNIRDGVKK